MEGHLEWTMAAPLWQLTGDPQDPLARRQFRTPTILRFANDSFMDEFLNLLNTTPQSLNEYVAAPETWSSPPNEPVAPTPQSGLALVLFRARNAAIRKLQAGGSRVIGQLPTTVAGKVLKLYQPAHGRFYLLVTCLVCRTLGLPDRRIDAGAQEKVTFVMRLLQPKAGADPQNPDPTQCNEFALVNGAWQAPTDPATLATGEEQRPLAPAAYAADDQRTRRLLVGLVPVGDRERLLQAVQPNPAGQPPLPPLMDPRQVLLKSQVLGPLCNLQQLAQTTQASTQPNPGLPSLTNDQETARENAVGGILQRGNNQLQQMSWYILLDLARYIQANIDNSLWQAIDSSDGSSLSGTLRPIWSRLSGATFSGTSMVTALKKISAAAAVDALDNIKTPYPIPDGNRQWPTTLFQFYSITATQVQGLNGLNDKDDRAAFEQEMVNALLPPPSNPLPPRLVAQANANPQTAVWFTMRCVLERPNCGALTPPLVSEPTVAFQMAPYFDSDAPARPIRIGLPIDTTPAGLRKFDKNTAFVMSDTLCGQVNKMSGMSFADLIMSVLPFPLHKDLDGGGGTPCTAGGLSAGMVCSFSIPIITIVALILLIIFVKLLDIIFFWMPFFQICLPLPKFSAKDS